MVKKYLILQNYIEKHEMNHYKIYNRYKSLFIIFILNLQLEWIDFIKLNTNLNLMKQCNKCLKEIRKYNFSLKEINEFEKEFLPKYPSKEWLIQKMYEYLRPDGYVGFGIIMYFFTIGLLYFSPITPFNNLIPIIILSITILYLFLTKNYFKLKSYYLLFKQKILY